LYFLWNHHRRAHCLVTSFSLPLRPHPCQSIASKLPSRGAASKSLQEIKKELFDLRECFIVHKSFQMLENCTSEIFRFILIEYTICITTSACVLPLALTSKCLPYCNNGPGVPTKANSRNVVMATTFSSRKASCEWEQLTDSAGRTFYLFQFSPLHSIPSLLWSHFLCCLVETNLVYYTSDTCK
jgi:hypothetical protein